MRLVRFGPPNEERPGVWLDPAPETGQAALLDVRAMAYDLADYDAHFFACHGMERLANLLRERHRRLVPAAGVRLGPPVARPAQLVCLGKNYAAHAAEFDAEPPAQPLFFAKAVSALSGPADPIRLPPGARRVDGEAELAVVLGRRARRVPAAAAYEYVAGYTLFNDVTDRDAQRAGGQWYRGKSADTFGPLGPFLVTRDEIPDPHDLRLYQRVNGRLLQDGHTGRMLFQIPALLAALSATITLAPGDILATGTPGGIGSARQPPVLLQPGDWIEVGADRLGQQRNPVVAAD